MRPIRDIILISAKLRVEELAEPQDERLGSLNLSKMTTCLSLDSWSSTCTKFDLQLNI